MTIERLLKVAPPPEVTFEAFAGPGEPIEAELGVCLPPDYKDFVRLYGLGGFLDHFLIVYVPACSVPDVHLATQVRWASSVFADDEERPYPFWPEPGGLLNFGHTGYGDLLFWNPQGAPADWPVVIWGRGMQRFEALACDLTDFLAGLATGDILPDDFPENLSTCDHLFQPHTPRPTRAKIGIAVANPANASLSFSWRFAGTEMSGVSTCRLRRQG